jgi:hypothetical protein
MALDRSGQHVLVPVVAAQTRATQLVSLDLSTRRLDTIAITRDSVGYPFIDVGRRTGNVYLVSGFGIRVLEMTKNGDIIGQRAFQRDSSHDWRVYAARVSADESRLYVSYHGGCSPGGPNTCTTGIDWISLEGPTEPCQRATGTPPGQGCAFAHGQFELLNDRMIAASLNGLAEIDPTGQRIRWRSDNLPLPGHYMNFALDTTSLEAYVAASCYAVGFGVSVVPVGTERPASMIPESTVYRICGDQIALSTDRAQIAVYNGNSGAIQLFDKEVWHVASNPISPAAGRSARNRSVCAIAVVR